MEIVGYEVVEARIPESKDSGSVKNLGLSVPDSTNEYSKVLEVFCYMGIFVFIVIVLEASVTILGIVTAIYILVWYFIIRYNKKKQDSTEQSNIDDINFKKMT